MHCVDAGTMRHQMDKQIRKLFAANFLGNLYFYLPVATLFFLGHGITLQTIVLANMVYSIVTFATEVPTGIIADRIGHHKAVSIGYALDAFSLLLVALFPSPLMLFLAGGILRGICGSFLSGSREALLYEYGKESGRSYKKDYSHLLSYEVLGFASGTLLAGVVVQIWGSASYVPVYVLTFAAVLSAALLAWSLVPHKTEREVGEGQLRELKQCLKLFRDSKMLRTLLVVVGLTYSGAYILVDLYPPHMTAHHVPSFFLGASLTAGSMAQYFITRHTYKIERFFGERLAVGLLATVVGLLYIAFGLFTNRYLLVASFVLLFGLTNTVTVFISDFANRHATTRIRATVLSGIGFGREVFKAGYKAIIALALGGLALSNVFALYGVFLVFGALLSYWLLRTEA